MLLLDQLCRNVRVSAEEIKYSFQSLRVTHVVILLNLLDKLDQVLLFKFKLCEFATWHEQTLLLGLAECISIPFDDSLDFAGLKYTLVISYKVGHLRSLILCLLLDLLLSYVTRCKEHDVPSMRENFSILICELVVTILQDFYELLGDHETEVGD